MGFDRSLSELKSIIDSQWKNGMLPHIRFVDGEKGYSPDADEWECYGNTLKDIYQTSGITQPPVIGIALLKLLQNHTDSIDMTNKNNIMYITDGIELFHDFLFKYRDPKNENLISLVHPWESGLDNSPIYDEENENALKIMDEMNIGQQIKDRQDLNTVISEFRPGEKDYNTYGKLMGYYKLFSYDQKKIAQNCPFNIQDLLYNIITSISIKSMIDAYKILNKIYKIDNSKLIQKNEDRLQKIEKAIKDKLYDADTDEYYAYSLNMNKQIKINTIQSLIASIYFETDPKKIREKIKSYQEDESNLSFLSTPSDSIYFDPIKYWRGPIWPIINWIIVELLKDKDEDLAKSYAKKTLGLIAEGYDLDKTYDDAISLMRFNLVFDSFTTPSKNQYKHGWFWDSAFASIGWNHTKDEEQSVSYEEIYNEKKKLIAQGKDLYSIRQHIKEKYKIALFDEYYVGVDTNTRYKKGEPIGSEMMTWTAAVYIDIYKYI